jgi:hypothetical protein
MYLSFASSFNSFHFGQFNPNHVLAAHTVTLDRPSPLIIGLIVSLDYPRYSEYGFAEG